MYIRKRWVVLFIAIILVSGVWYLYRAFFDEDQADKVCCQKHYLTVPNVLTITESTPIPILDSSKANQQITYNILNQVQEGLMRLGKDNLPVLGLAEKYQISPDYRTYRFTLRKQAVWSDGQPVTAKDFQYAWLRALSPANDYAFSYLFYGIQGAEAYASAKATEEKVAIQVSGERQLTVKLAKPDPNFLSLVTLTPFLPLRRDLVEKYGEDYATSPETMSFTGPFVLQTFTPQKAELINNTQYWDRNNVKLAKAEIKIEVSHKRQQGMFHGEETAMIKWGDNQPKQVEKIDVDQSVADFLELNWKKRFFRNKLVRQAIQLQLQQLGTLPTTMTQATGLLPPGTTARNKQLARLQEKASVLLAQGLHELGMSSAPDLSLLTYDDDRSIKLAIIIRQRLLILGIPVTVRKLSPSEKSKEEINSNFDLSVSEWSLKYPDTLEFLSLWAGKSPTNISGFASTSYDTLLQKIEVTADLNKRDQLSSQAENYLLLDQAAVVPLVYLHNIRLQKPYVKNVWYHPFGAEYSLKWASYQPPKQIEATK